jgi:hypothetical protein
MWGLGSSVAEPGRPCFYAGLQCGPEGPLAQAANETWITALLGQGFEMGPERRDWWLTSYLQPSKLLAKARAQGQAEILAAWVLHEFGNVSSPPPPG